LGAVDEIGKIEPAKIEGNALAAVLPPPGKPPEIRRRPG